MAPLGKMSVMTHARPCAIFSRKLIKPQNKETARGRMLAYTFFFFLACFGKESEEERKREVQCTGFHPWVASEHNSRAALMQRIARQRARAQARSLVAGPMANR